jgi:hypothetical protein
MQFVRLVSVAALSLAASSFAIAQNVSFDYDKAADFARFKTYTWVKGTPVPDALNHQRVQRGIDAQLTRHGLIAVTPLADPDVFVAYHATFDRDLRITGFSSGWGPYRFGPARSGTVRTEEILTGTLVVDIVNARTNVIAWRGMAVKDVDVHASADARDRSIHRTAEKLFKHFPPVKPASR